MESEDWKLVWKATLIVSCFIGLFIAITYVVVFAVCKSWIYGAIGTPIILLGLFAMKPLWPTIKSLIYDPI